MINAANSKSIMRGLCQPDVPTARLSASNNSKINRAWRYLLEIALTTDKSQMHGSGSVSLKLAYWQVDKLP